MRKGRILFSLFLIALAAYAVQAARGWTFKAALFPMSVGIPLIILVAAQLLLDLFSRANRRHPQFSREALAAALNPHGIETANGPALDLEFAAGVPPDVARRRATTIFLWVAGFILLVFLLGFPIAVPLFMFSYLRLQSKAGWWQSIGLTGLAWGFFYVVFERVIRLQFEAGLIQSWLGM